MDKINKLSLPAVILIASIILGGFYFASQVNKQRSIERQQEVKIEQKRQETEVKAEQDQRDYVAKRKTECLAIYKTESDKYSNVHSWHYIEPVKNTSRLNLLPARSQLNLSALLNINDKCQIIYKDDAGETFKRNF